MAYRICRHAKSDVIFACIMPVCCSYLHVWRVIFACMCIYVYICVCIGSTNGLCCRKYMQNMNIWPYIYIIHADTYTEYNTHTCRYFNLYLHVCACMCMYLHVSCLYFIKNRIFSKMTYRHHTYTYNKIIFACMCLYCILSVHMYLPYSVSACMCLYQYIYVCICIYMYVLVYICMDYALGHNYAPGGCSIYTWDWPSCICLYMHVSVCIGLYHDIWVYIYLYMYVYVHIILYMHVYACIWSYHTVYACIVLINMLEISGKDRMGTYKWWDARPFSCISQFRGGR